MESVRNAFSGFVEANKTGFDELGSLSSRLKSEVAAWRKSKSLEVWVQQLTRLSVLTGVKNPRLQQRIDNKALNTMFRSVQGKIEGVIFKQAEDEEAPIPPSSREKRLALQFQRQVPTIYRNEWNRLTEELEEFSDDFDGETRPLLTSLRQTKQELFDRFRNYLSGDFPQLADLNDFLNEPTFVGQREGIRPFLVRLAKFEFEAPRGANSLDQQRITWTEKLLNGGLPEPLLAEFCEQKLTGGFGIEKVEKRGKDIVVTVESSEFMDMLKFAILLIRMQDLDYDDIDLHNLDIVAGLSKIPRISWPRSIMDAYELFVKQKVTGVVEGIKKGLVTYYRREKPNQFEIEIPKVSAKREKGKSNGQEGQDDVTLPDLSPQAIYLPVALLHRNDKSVEWEVLSEEALQSYVVKTSTRFAQDERMQRDCLLAVNDLRKEPWGVGTKKMLTGQMTVDSRTIRLREYAPGRRSWLKLEHPLTSNLRLAYAVLGNGNDRVVALEGIFKHDEFDRRYRV
ncbi:hypothetical protein HY387_00220 [Candidatus Daviesbacteria bacterium]|nr:hypothetical protein [Candidatus Daviesbacteria bacterium]